MTRKTPKTSSELLEEQKKLLIANYSSTTQGENPIGAMDMSEYIQIQIAENASNYVRLGNLPKTFSIPDKIFFEKGEILLTRERLILEEERLRLEEEERNSFVTIGGS